MKTKKTKAVYKSLTCSCGYQWTAIFSSGVLRRVVACPNCRQQVKTSSGEKIEPERCPGCQRPKWNRNGLNCFYCGYIIEK